MLDTALYYFTAVDTEFTGLAASPSDEPRLVVRLLYYIEIETIT